MLTLLLLPALPVFAIVGWIIAKRIFTQSTEVQEGFSTLSAQVQENLNGIRTIQTHAQEERETERFEATSDAYAGGYYKLMFLNSALTSAMLVATGFTTLLVVGYGGMQVIDGTITLGTSQRTCTRRASQWSRNNSSTPSSSVRRVRHARSSVSSI